MRPGCIPGRFRPGLIEAAATLPEVMGIGCIPGRFRPGLIEACNRRNPHRPFRVVFPGDFARASLKPLVIFNAPPFWQVFPGDFARASLKLPFVSWMNAISARIPGRFRPGLIEARLPRLAVMM